MTFHAFFFLLCAVEICKAQPSCKAFPSQYVQVGANITIYCIIQDGCKGAVIHRDTIHQQSHIVVNTTTIMHEAQGILANTTYTCKCPQKPEELCGFDIYVGYPPDVPQNLTCEQKGENGNVTCTWETGKETFWTESEFGIKSSSGTSPKVIYSGKNSATFHPGSETRFFISMRASNILGQSAIGEMNVTLSHIVRPRAPVLAKVECTSRICHLLITNVGSCHLLELQHRRDQGHWSMQLFNRTESNHNWNISVSLEPFVHYHFRARLRLRPHMGLWSHWSGVSQHWTQEEAPNQKLDIWYFKESPRTYVLLWKKLTESEARGRILGYTVSVENNETKMTTSWNVTNSTFTNFTVQLCSQCIINISAFNSKGYSPPANIAILGDKEGRPQRESHVTPGNGSIAISWRKHHTAAAGLVTNYLVEWCPAGRSYKELHWQRLNRDQLSINITGLHAHECYKVTLYALFKDGRWKEEYHISTQPQVPEKGPDIARIRPLVYVDNAMVVSWNPVPRNQWRGCITRYTIYVQGPKGERYKYDVKAKSREFTSREFNISGLTIGQQYSVCMTAWTEAGESPLGEVRSFTVKHKKEPSPLVFGVLVTSFSVICFFLVLVCLCHAFSLRRRCLRCCHLHPDMVPDPANSKWAKECSGLKGEMSLNLYLSDSSVSSEDEPDTVEVQEMPSEGLVTGALLGLGSTNISISTSTSLQQEQDEDEEPGVCLTYTLKSPSAYLKSYSHESDQTQASQNTEMTVDYISTQGMLSGESDGEEEQEEVGVCTDGPSFFPCPLFDPRVSIGGKLTLDSVKIDCSDFLDEPFLFIADKMT